MKDIDFAVQKVRESFWLRHTGRDREAVAAWCEAVAAVPQQLLKEVGWIESIHPTLPPHKYDSGQDEFWLCIPEHGELSWDSYAHVSARELPAELVDMLRGILDRTESVPF